MLKYQYVTSPLESLGMPSRTASSAENVSTVHRNCLPVEILTGCEEQNRIRHVPVLSGPRGGDLALVLFPRDVGLLLLVALTRRHLAGEHARSDAVHPHPQPVLRDLVRQHPRQMNSGGFAGIVGEMVLRCLDDPGDARVVDDDAGKVVVVLVRGFQERQESGRHEEELRHVGAVRVGPHLKSLVRVVEEVGRHFFRRPGLGLLGVQGDAGVVEQDAETPFARRDVGHEPLDLVLFGHVARQWDDFAGDVFAVDVGHSLQFLFGPADDVDSGAIGGQGLSSHQANA